MGDHPIKKRDAPSLPLVTRYSFIFLAFVAYIFGQTLIAWVFLVALSSLKKKKR